MIKKGFTLTEVLITLALIGVIAALTVPALFTHTRNAHLGAQYANAISTLENGIGLYLYDKNVRKLTQLQEGAPTPTALLGTLANEKYIKMTSFGDLPAGLPDGCGNAYTLPDKSVVGSCSNTQLTVHQGDAGQELFFLSSMSTNQKNVIEGLDFFRMSLSADGLIYIPGRDYGDSTCDELNGGKGCAGRVAANGWKYDRKIFDN